MINCEFILGVKQICKMKKIKKCILDNCFAQYASILITEWFLLYIYICIYACVHIHIYMHIYTYIRAYIYIYRYNVYIDEVGEKIF